MTWFLRKSFCLGPLRLNLSKRGLGALVGVKGARIGVDTEGRPYVFGGRRGLYFREPLAAGRARSISPRPGTNEMTPTPRARPWMLLVLLALLLGFVIGVLLAHAGAVTAQIGPLFPPHQKGTAR